MWPRAWGPLGRKAPPAGFGGSSAWTVDQRPQTQTKTAVSEAASVSCAEAAPVSTLQRTGTAGTWKSLAVDPTSLSLAEQAGAWPQG